MLRFLPLEHSGCDVCAAHEALAYGRDAVSDVVKALRSGVVHGQVISVVLGMQGLSYQIL